MQHYNRTGGLSDRQFGFREKHSTVTQMLNCLDLWSKNLSTKRVTYVCYIDLKKAFDSVNHRKLLIALKSKGFGDSVLHWLKSYLTDRTQQVTMGDVFSANAAISSGVLQGSCIGPCAFLGLIDSCIRRISEIEGVEIFGFADDLKVWSNCPQKLQAALCQIESWCASWQLRVAPQKCLILQIGQGPSPTFSLAGANLPYVDSAVDLGFTVDRFLTFSEHCQSLAKKAKSTAYLTLRCFNTGRVAPLVRAYTTYVRPKLEYGTQVFYPVHSKDSEPLERVQKYFTRRIFAKCRMRETDYESRLKFLGLDRLDIRRAKLDLLLGHKMFHGKCHDSNLLTMASSSGSTHHPCNLLKEKSGNLVRSTFFSNRIVNMWNKLPEHIVRDSEDKLKDYIKL